MATAKYNIGVAVVLTMIRQSIRAPKAWCEFFLIFASCDIFCGHVNLEQQEEGSTKTRNGEMRNEKLKNEEMETEIVVTIILC